jgi:hypothetical protein
MARTPAADQTAATATALPIEVTKSGRTRRRKGCERTDLTTNTKQTGQTQQSPQGQVTLAARCPECPQFDELDREKLHKYV